MDVKAILALLALVMAASTPEEKEKLLNEMKAQLEANAGGGEPPAPASEPPPVAKPPEEKPADAQPSNDAGMRDEEMAKRYKKDTDAGIAVLLDARKDLSSEQRDYVKNECKSIAGAAAYLKTIPLAKPQEAAKPPEQLGTDKAPRGGSGGPNGSPSGDAKVNALFRIMPTDATSDGITTGEPGKLFSFSVVGAYPKIKKATADMVVQQKARMFGGAA